MIKTKSDKSPLATPEIASLLDDLGLALGTHGVEIIDFKQAESCYIHHTRVPVAATGYALISPSFARGRFPQFSFIDMIHKRPSMDETEACALAAVCDIEVTPPFWGNPAPFAAHLWEVVDRYELDAFFQRVEHRYGNGDHYMLRPRGFDYDNPDRPEIPGALKKWRDNYKKLSTVRQLMTVTILQLYLQSEERFWLVRVPKKWHAAEAIDILNAQEALADWARLYALYPGW